MRNGSKKPKSRWSRLYRRRQRARYLIATAATFGFVIVALITALLLLATRPQTLTVAAGPREGVDARIVQEIARSLAHEKAKVRLELVYTENPNSFGLVASGRADIAVTRADSLSEDALALLVLRKSALLVWSATKEKPAQLKDVKGNRTGVVGGTPEDIALVKFVFEASGHTFEIGALDARTTGGYALNTLVSPVESKATRDVIAQAGQPHFVPIEIADAIVRKHPRLESVELPKGALSVNPPLPVEPLQTVAVAHLLVASKALSEEKASAFAQAVFANRHAILRETAGEGSLEKPDTEKDAAIPPHPGVAAYIDGTERTFMERYSDVFWGTVLLLSGIGSAGAWFRALYYRDELDDTATMRDQLLELVTKLRDETSIGDIAGMERKADTLLRETLDRYERGAVDDGTLAAFGLALEHFRDVARSRRASGGTST
jgi:TRAP-type uncharacterized transport system substrate-binding protein